MRPRLMVARQASRKSSLRGALRGRRRCFQSQSARYVSCESVNILRTNWYAQQTLAHLPHVRLERVVWDVLVHFRCHWPDVCHSRNFDWPAADKMCVRVRVRLEANGELEVDQIDLEREQRAQRLGTLVKLDIGEFIRPATSGEIRKEVAMKEVLMNAMSYVMIGYC